MSHYPKWKYHPDKEARIVHTADAEKALGAGWFESPADFGVETCPGKVPDPVIAAKRFLTSIKPVKKDKS